MKVQLAWLTIAALLSACLAADEAATSASGSLVVINGDAQHIGHVQSAACNDELLKSTISNFVQYGENGTQYVECTSIGWGLLKQCEEGSIFDLSTGLCATAIGMTTEALGKTTKTAVIEPASSTVTEQSVESTTSTEEPAGVTRNSRFLKFFGLVSGMNNCGGGNGGWKGVSIRGRLATLQNCTGNNLCVNGVCSEWWNSTKCICLIGYTGEFCETSTLISGSNQSSVVDWSLYDQINGGKFNLDEYLANEYGNISGSDSGDNEWLPADKKSFFESFGTDGQSNFLDNQSFNVTYEEFVTRFVDQLWMDINKEGMYLYMYNFSQVFNESNVPGALDRIRFYARYQLFNFDTRFAQFEQALNMLAGQLANSSMKLNAIANVESVHVEEKQRVIVNGGNTKVAIVTDFAPIEVHEHVLNRTGYIAAIKGDFNRTLCRTNKLYGAYIAPTEKYTSEQTNGFLAKLHNSTVSNWNGMVDYGFKYFTYKLSGNKVVSAESQQAAVGTERVFVAVKRTSDSVFQDKELSVFSWKMQGGSKSATDESIGAKIMKLFQKD